MRYMLYVQPQSFDPDNTIAVCGRQLLFYILHCGSAIVSNSCLKHAESVRVYGQLSEGSNNNTEEDGEMQNLEKQTVVNGHTVQFRRGFVSHGFYRASVVIDGHVEDVFSSADSDADEIWQRTAMEHALSRLVQIVEAKAAKRK
jgi:hypothetical protein